ncbi:MAG: DUF3047 domain-containing protein [Salinibacter sp.]|uniref:DUF3047 domain-containing protein n=1 Tax=Salinibacter sp. TaxID=2065818 RepID=UPI0035D4DB5D
MTRSLRRGLHVAGGVALGLLLLLGTAAAPDALRIGHFSMADADSNGHPVEWRPISFSDVDEKTRYQLVQRPVQGDTTTVVRALSDGGASGLVRRMRISPDQHPILTWRWRVSNVLEDGNARKKSGDDYPARIYVSFDYDPSNLGFFDRAKYEALQALGYDQIPTRALNYVWASTVETGTVLPNPFTDWVQMIPVESGSAKVGTWVREQRDIRADYREAFGEDPPPINGVAIMTDTDNTGGAATAYYGDIVVRKQPGARLDTIGHMEAPTLQPE